MRRRLPSLVILDQYVILQFEIPMEPRIKDSIWFPSCTKNIMLHLRIWKRPHPENSVTEALEKNKDWDQDFYWMLDAGLRPCIKFSSLKGPMKVLFQNAVLNTAAMC